MSCAWPDPEPGHRHDRGVLRERRQGRGRGGHQGPGDARSSSPRTASPTSTRHSRVLARPAGPDHPPDGQAARRHALRADRLGRGVRAGRRRAEGARQPGRGHLLHLRAGRPTRPRSPTSCSPARSAPTTCRTARTCATSRRQHRAAGVDRHRQGQRHAATTCTSAKLIVIAGQNPGTNHPRMLTALENAKRNGAKILAINPLREAGLLRFKNPQNPRGVVGHGTALSDLHLPIKINGDLALFQALGLAAGRVGRARPRLHRAAHHRVRRVARARRRRRLGRRHRRPPG